MKNESQYGLLLLQRYLYEHTDDQHPASVADILAFWLEHGIQAGRKSVYSAIEVLQSNGMDIVCVKSTQNRYFVGVLQKKSIAEVKKVPQNLHS